jgi:poly(3-hydroxybutyrate) depolymerase
MRLTMRFFLMLACALLVSVSACSAGNGDQSSPEDDTTVDPTGAGGDGTSGGAGGDTSSTAGSSTTGSTGGSSNASDSGVAKGGSSNNGGSTGTGGAAMMMMAVDSGPPMPSSGCAKDPVLAPKDAQNTGWPYFWAPKNPAAPAKGEVPPLTINGKLRTFSVYVPASYDRNHPYPVYFSFHGCGGGSSPTSYIASSKDHGIIVAPQGLAGSCGGNTTGWLSAKGSEDYTFFDKMVEYLESGFCVDKNKIYASGHSHGAYFVGNLGCWRGDVLRAINPQSGGPATMTDCVGKVAYIGLHHVMDGSVPIAQGMALRDQFAKANHCMTTTTPMSQAPCVQFNGCDPGYPVAWCPITGTMLFDDDNNPATPPIDVSPHNVWAWPPTGDTMWNFFYTLPNK